MAASQKVPSVLLYTSKSNLETLACRLVFFMVTQSALLWGYPFEPFCYLSFWTKTKWKTKMKCCPLTFKISQTYVAAYCPEVHCKCDLGMVSPLLLICTALVDTLCQKVADSSCLQADPFPIAVRPFIGHHESLIHSKSAHKYYCYFLRLYLETREFRRRSALVCVLQVFIGNLWAYFLWSTHFSFRIIE